MKKINKIWMFVLFSLVITVFLSSFSSALGIAPSRQVINYDENEITLQARIINNENKDMKIGLYAEGELAEYINIDKKIIKVSSGQSEVVFYYTIKLPSQDKLTPGQIESKILAVELPDESTLADENTRVSASTAVIQQIWLNVPYPSMYADGKLYISPVKKGGDLGFSIGVYNRGNVNIKSYADIIIKGPTNEVLKEFKTGDITIETSDSGKLYYSYDNVDLNEGMYLAEAVVHYTDGKKEEHFTLRSNFYVGEEDIEIRDIKVNDFSLGNIAKFDVLLKSRWNEKIKDVYADMEIFDNSGNMIANFKTNEIDIPALSEETISGYWDTKGINVGEYDLNVVVHYGGKTKEEMIIFEIFLDNIQFKGFGTGYATNVGGGEGQYTLLIMLIIILIVINVGWFVYFKFMKK